MRKPGRPRVYDGPTERIDLRLPGPVYDALCRDALRRGEDVRKRARDILTAGVSAVENRQQTSSP